MVHAVPVGCCGQHYDPVQPVGSAWLHTAYYSNPVLLFQTSDPAFKI
jgi:hypothetical protein